MLENSGRQRLAPDQSLRVARPERFLQPLVQAGLTDIEAMEHIAKTIDVDRPVGMVYNQWTQVEEFPRFMDGITEVRQLDATHVHWRATISSKDKEWDAEITEQVPDEGIAWRSVSGNAPHADAVRFEPLADGRTRVHLVIAYEYIESRGIEDGAWRGTVHECAVPPSPLRERS